MFKSFLKNVLPDFILNLILKLYISFVRLRTFKTSQSFWNENTVSSPKNGFKSIESKSIKDSIKKITGKERKIIVIFGSLYLVGHALSLN